MCVFLSLFVYISLIPLLSSLFLLLYYIISIFFSLLSSVSFLLLTSIFPFLLPPLSLSPSFFISFSLPLFSFVRYFFSLITLSPSIALSLSLILSPLPIIFLIEYDLLQSFHFDIQKHFSHSHSQSTFFPSCLFFHLRRHLFTSHFSFTLEKT
jgi:hypothetical protein